MGAADIHRRRALAAQHDVLRQPLADVAEQPVVGARRRVVLDLRPDHLGVLGRLLGQRLAPRRALRVEPLTPGQRLVHLLHDRLAVTEQRHLGRLVLVHRLGVDVELDDLDIRVVARRQPEMQDPVEAGAHQEHDVGLLQGEGARGAGRQRVVVRHDALALRGAHERDLGLLHELAHLLGRAGIAHALADQRERALGRLQHVEGALDVHRHRLGARRLRALRDLLHLGRSSHEPVIRSSAMSR